MNTRIAVIFAAAALGLGAVAGAQIASPQGNGGGRFGNSQQRNSDAVKTVLDLTDRQFNDLSDLRDAHNQKLQDLSSQIRDLQQQQRAASSAGSGPAQVGALVLQVQTLQQQMQDEMTSYHDNAMKLLDSGQKEKVQAIEDALKLAPSAGALSQYGLLDTSQMSGGGRNNFLGGNGAMMMMRGAGNPPQGGGAPAATTSTAPATAGH
jgi:hypothetical protein